MKHPIVGSRREVRQSSSESMYEVRTRRSNDILV